MQIKIQKTLLNVLMNFFVKFKKKVTNCFCRSIVGPGGLVLALVGERQGVPEATEAQVARQVGEAEQREERGADEERRRHQPRLAGHRRKRRERRQRTKNRRQQPPQRKATPQARAQRREFGVARVACQVDLHQRHTAATETWNKNTLHEEIFHPTWVLKSMSLKFTKIKFENRHLKKKTMVVVSHDNS